MRSIKLGAVLLPTVLLGACAQQAIPPAAVANITREVPRDPVASGTVPGSTAGEAIDAAITALGGSERISVIRNITMVGYGRHAYQQGGGNITALPNASQKYIAANDLRRIYDLEHKRYSQQTIDFIQPGIDNVRRWCAEHERAGNYFAGCPGFIR